MPLSSVVKVYLFGYGVLFHFMVCRILMGALYREPVASSFISESLIIVPLLGGMFVSLLMTPVVLRWKQSGTFTLFISLLRAAFFGLLATFLTLQAFLLLTAVSLASSSGYKGPRTWMSLPEMMFLAFLDVETYGAVPLILSMPFGFLSGVGVGVFVAFTSKTRTKHENDCRYNK